MRFKRGIIIRIMGNSFMRSVRALLLLAVVAGGAYVYETQFKKSPCEVPLRYSIGTFDNRFGVSEETFKDAAQEASGMWEEAYGKKLLEFDPTGALVINLKYDDRQKLTQKNDALKTDINATRGLADSVKQEFTSLQGQYNTSQAEYENALALFKQHQNDYNSQVSYWNSRGGAPKKDFDILNEQKNDIAQERDALEQKRLAVNALANQVNALVSKYNILAKNINLNVDEINSTAGEAFSEGEYHVDETGKQEINVYQFEDKDMLVHVLAHEIGHALGLGHNPSKDSIMYAFNQSSDQKIDTTDVLALREVCGE